MKGDFSRWAFDPVANFSGVLYQQGRVRTDADDNAASRIAAHWRETAARDVIGAGIAAAPADAGGGFKVLAAKVAAGSVAVRLQPGRLWADGLHLHLPSTAPVELPAAYLAPPLQAPQASVATIAAGVRDAVVLEVWEESVSAFQEPLHLLEPALGGPDTTERSRVCARLALLRLGPNDDCSAVAGTADDFAAKGKLTVTPGPAILIPGDCPVEAGGGYTGFEHCLYRIEIAEPLAGAARFKWSQFNGGLVGRGRFAAGVPGSGTVTITANDQMVNHSGLASFYFEALVREPVFGGWSVALTADATLPQDGTLDLTNIQGTWPAAPGETAFFRLWNGIRRVADFPLGASPAELQDGIHLALDAPAAGNVNYAPGDYWTFPVRAAGTPFDPALLPSQAPPQGIRHHRVALATLTWNATLTAADDQGEIEDCRQVFPPLSRQRGCCTYTVGDGVRSHGSFDSIEAALAQLPAAGGEICLLPGLHQTNAVIRNRRDVRIHGCHGRTKLVPRQASPGDPILRIVDSVGIVIEAVDMVTLGGIAILIDSERPGGVADVAIADNRILACQNAIRAVNAAALWIHHNRIRMLDKRGSGVAIDLAADDSLVERNDIRLIPAPAMPPLDVPDDPTPIDPNDPCARLELVYVNPLLFLRYVNLVWRVPLLLLPLLTRPYQALGGIQIEGGSERVRLLENTIAGGAGNGVTLGSGGAAPPAPPAPVIVDLPAEGRILGQVAGPDGKPVANAQVTLTRRSDLKAKTAVADQNGRFTTGMTADKLTVEATAPGLTIDKAVLRPRGDNLFDLVITLKVPDAAAEPQNAGFLYAIAIEGNSITAMGLSGIGVPRLDPRLAGNAATLALLGNPVIGLEIRRNRIAGCLLNPFDPALQAEAALRGLGGVSLGFCEDATIADNRIEGNGPTAVNPSCGIFVFHGEGVAVTANQIVENGPLPDGAADLKLAAGRRGGIVLNFVSSFNLLSGLSGAKVSTARRIDPRPAARIHENVVDQPAGQALYVAGFGPVACTDNSFISELTGLAPAELLAGTVFIFNIGGTQRAAAGRQLKPAAGNQNLAAGFARSPAAIALLPGGNVLFDDNQSRTGTLNRSAVCQWIGSLDDVGYQGNQSASERAGNLFSNVFLGAATLRATGNRMSESGPETLMSLFTLTQRLNDTSLNQGDHCIIAVNQDASLAEVQLGNQVLNPGPLCARFAAVAVATFKP